MAIKYFNEDPRGFDRYTYPKSRVSPGMAITPDWYEFMKTIEKRLLKGGVFDMPTVSVPSVLKPKKVIYCSPATIVFWGDGTKTVAICSEDTEFDEYTGFCIAVTKKLFGSNDAIREAAGAPKWGKNKKPSPIEPVKKPPFKPGELKVGDVVKVVNNLRAVDTRSYTCVAGDMTDKQGELVKITNIININKKDAYKIFGSSFNWDISYFERV